MRSIRCIEKVRTARSLMKGSVDPSEEMTILTLAEEMSNDDID